MLKVLCYSLCSSGVLLTTWAVVWECLFLNVGVQALLQSHALIFVFPFCRGSLLGGWHGNRNGRGAVMRVSDLLAVVALQALLVRELKCLCRITSSGALILRNNLDKVLEELERILGWPWE